MGIVVFDITAFRTRYPEFSVVSDSMVNAAFIESEGFFNNTNTGLANLQRRAILLNYLTAHILALSGAVSGDGKAKPVGRVESATKGTVTVSFAYAAGNNASWYLQTQYGAAFWQATVALRGFRYLPCPTVY